MPAVPRVSPDEAEEIARRCYGISGTAQRQAAEHDDTFRIAGDDGVPRLLKIGVAEAAGPREPVSFQTAVLQHLAAVAPQLPVQRVITAIDGRPEVSWGEGGHDRIVRLTSWLDGDLVVQTDGSTALRRDLGAMLARLSLALRGFTHPGARRTHWWDLQNLVHLRPLLRELPDSGMLPEVAATPSGGEFGGGLRAALEDFLDRFDAVVRPRFASVPTQVIHTDFHGHNLLCRGGRITGILDFGDALTGPVAMDVAVAACYQLGTGTDVLAPALEVIAAYHQVDPLDEADLQLIPDFLAARIVARLIVSQWNAQREPSNQGYLLRRTPQAIEQFAALRQLPPEEIAGRLREACREPFHAGGAA